eukprot:g1322.t1
MSRDIADIGAQSTGAATGDDSEAAQEATLADINRGLDLLSSKLEILTHQLQEVVDAERQRQHQAGASAARPSTRVEFAGQEQRDQKDDQRGIINQPGAEPRPGFISRPAETMDVEQAGEGRRLAEDGDDTRQAFEEEEEEREGSWGWGRDGRRFGPAWLAVMTFVHEVWLLLQHANILLNPLCQRLDRSYGVALLKRRLYWVIAGVLSAYWAREVLSMLIASPYASPLTLKMVAMSSVYHVGKILLISLDAKRQWSPTLGIMRLLMDHWHLSSLKDALLCAKRVSLQAFDTATHALLVRDMVRWDEESADTKLWLYRKLLIVFFVWAIHAIANVVTRVSTATLVVELAKGLVGSWGAADSKRSRSPAPSYGMLERGGGTFGALDGGRAEYAYTSSCSHGHNRCEVCYLLTRDKPVALAPPPPAQRKRVD